MNLQTFRKNIGRTLEFRPIPRRDTPQGSWESDKNLWILQAETPDKKGFLFENAHTDHPSLLIETIYLKNYDFMCYKSFK